MEANLLRRSSGKGPAQAQLKQHVKAAMMILLIKTIFKTNVRACLLMTELQQIRHIYRSQERQRIKVSRRLYHLQAQKESRPTGDYFSRHGLEHP